MAWDYIVIGAGSAGCAAAHQLVGSGKTVLVVEAGGSDLSPTIKVPALELQAVEKFDWGYQAQPDPTRNGVAQQWTRGKVLGGSSSINGMIYVRGAREDFDRWSALCGNTGAWSADDVMPIFQEIENSDQAGDIRGHAGALYTRTVKKPHAVTTAFLQAANAAGHAINADYNGETQDGVSYIQFTQHHGLRFSAADAFLKPLRGRGNLEILLNATVERIEIANGRAIAVLLRHKGAQRREEASDIVLSAGAINSPKILMLSGIGERQQIERHGIEVKVELPAVGYNLQEHPLVYLAYRMNEPTYTPIDTLWKKFQAGAKFMTGGEGPVSNLFEAIGFIRSSDDKPHPDLQLYFSAIGYIKTPKGFSLAPFPAVMLCVGGTYPLSKGCVRLASADPDAPPVIDFPLLDKQADIDALAGGAKAIRKIMNEQPVKNWVAEELLPGPAVENDAEIEAFIRDSTTISFHTIGTCRMGHGDNTVVGPDLKVHGVENLWIADASIVPAPISANMNGPCIMIGTKLGKQLVARR